MANKLAYFSGELSDFLTGPELWVTDGTAQGTRELSVSGARSDAFGPIDITQFGSRLLMGGLDARGKVNLFISNGTGSGTDELLTAGASPYGLFVGTFPGNHGGTEQFGVLQKPFAVLGSKAVFPGVDAANHVQLWSTDGTTPGTREVVAAGASGGGLSPSSITAVGSIALFAGVGAGESNYSSGLWVTDGTDAGTRELHPANAGGLDPSAIAAVNGKALFNGIDAAGNSGLWVSDGTDQGTTELTVANAGTRLGVDYGPYGLNPLDITAFGHGALFTGFDSSGRDSLWTTDGTSAGTREIVPAGAFAAGLFDTYAGPQFTAFGNEMLFAGKSATDGEKQLWITDGTQAGTKPLTNSAQGELDEFGPGGPGAIATIGAKAVFGDYYGADHKRQLWVTDGTPAGTSALTPAGANSGGVLPLELTSLGSVAVFTGSDANEHFDLWTTDGTTAGTHVVVPAGSPGKELDPSGFLATTPSSAPILGGAFGPSLIEGTPGDDTIVASGADNTIRGDGGSDTITTGAGGYTRVTEGSPGDGATGATTVALYGRANAVTGGDEDFAIDGGTGFTGVTLGGGDDTVTLGGTYNTVTAGEGTNVIDAGGGFSSVSIMGEVGNAVPDDTITVAGQHDQVLVSASAEGRAAFGKLSVTGGTGYGKFALGLFEGTVTTDGLYNTVTSLGGGPSTITPGSGYDTVDLGTQGVFFGPGAKTVHLAGTHNTVEGEAAPATVTGGSGYGRFLFDRENDNGVVIPGTPPSHAYTVTTAGPYNTFSLLDTNANTVVTGGDGARVTVADPTLTLEPGQPANPPLVFKPTDVTFGGVNNLLTAADGPVTARGGAGYGTFTLGNGDDSLTTSGAGNRITLGRGRDTLGVTGDHATVTLNGTAAALTLTGAGDRVFLNAGASGTLGGGSLPDLHLVVASGIGREVVTGLANDPRTVVDLVGGAGGYATPAGVVAALRADGAGGTVLAVGAGALDFAGVAPGDIHAGMFVVG